MFGENGPFHNEGNTSKMAENRLKIHPGIGFSAFSI